MKPIVRFFPAIILFALLSGCFQVEKVIHVKADGSGTVEETVLMSKEAVAQLKAMSKQMAEQMGGENAEGATEEFSLLDEKSLKKQAEKMGEGVTFVSAEKVSTDTGEGYKAVYAFEDVTKLKVNQNPGDSAPTGPGGGSSTSPQENIVFEFGKGDPSLLVINLPKQEPGEGEGEAEETDAADSNVEAEMEQMKAIFQDMRMAVRVAVDGEIVETNATYRDGSKVTLMEIDFGKLVSDLDAFKRLAKQKPDSLEEAKEILGQVEGVKIETERPVNVRFK